MYSLSFNNFKLELPKCSLDIQENIENLLYLDKEVRARRVKYRILAENMYSFAVDLLSEEKIYEIFNCSGIDDIDVKELEILIINIIRAYNEKLEEVTYKRDFEPINKAIKDPKVTKLIELAASAKSL